jgi:hypothetical protein
MAELRDARPRRHPDIRQSGAVQDHQPDDPGTGDADLGSARTLRVRIAARRDAVEKKDSMGDADSPGPRVPLSLLQDAERLVIQGQRKRYLRSIPVGGS